MKKEFTAEQIVEKKIDVDQKLEVIHVIKNYFTGCHATVMRDVSLKAPEIHGPPMQGRFKGVDP